MINPVLSPEALARDMFKILAQAFPIACATDEFFYFPQVQLSEIEWGKWDDFSGDTINGFLKQLSTWEGMLDLLASQSSDPDEQIDIALLQKMTRALREQLSEVRFWETQPTFYLTLLCIGLAEALQAEDPAAKQARARGIPAFLDQAGRNLNHIPVLFRDLGLEMVSDTRDYLVSIGKTLPEVKPALNALERFGNVIRQGSACKDFLLPRDLLEHIIRFHIH